MPKSAKVTAHEGARESLKPGEPTERQVITPGWAELEKRRHRGDKPAGPTARRKARLAGKTGRG